VEDVQRVRYRVPHLLGACSNLGQDPKGEYQAHDDDVAHQSHTEWMTTLVNLHFETHVYLQANNDIYMWNQVNWTKKN